MKNETPELTPEDEEAYRNAERCQHLVRGEEVIDKIAAIVCDTYLDTKVKVALMAVCRKVIYTHYSKI